MEVALRAEGDPFEVSLPLLIEALPQFGSQGRDGMGECVRQGRRLGIIRPSTRLHIQAPEITRDLLIPLPKDTPLCRQPHYHRKTSANTSITSDQQSSSNTPRCPNIEVHPQRDQIVAILMQREARLKATARQARAKPLVRPQNVSIKTETTNVSAGMVAVRPMSAVQPDPSIALPPWTFLQPLVAST
jgi:hypothetical protein